MKAGNCEELGKELKDEQYRIYCFDSSLGLSGYVIAKDIKSNQHKINIIFIRLCGVCFIY